MPWRLTSIAPSGGGTLELERAPRKLTTTPYSLSHHRNRHLLSHTRQNGEPAVCDSRQHSLRLELYVEKQRASLLVCMPAGLQTND